MNQKVLGKFTELMRNKKTGYNYTQEISQNNIVNFPPKLNSRNMQITFSKSGLCEHQKQFNILSDTQKKLSLFQKQTYSSIANNVHSTTPEKIIIFRCMDERLNPLVERFPDHLAISYAAAFPEEPGVNPNNDRSVKIAIMGKKSQKIIVIVHEDCGGGNEAQYNPVGQNGQESALDKGWKKIKAEEVFNRQTNIERVNLAVEEAAKISLRNAEKYAEIYGLSKNNIHIIRFSVTTGECALLNKKSNSFVTVRDILNGDEELKKSFPEWLLNTTKDSVKNDKTKNDLVKTIEELEKKNEQLSVQLSGKTYTNGTSKSRIGY